MAHCEKKILCETCGGKIDRTVLIESSSGQEDFPRKERWCKKLGRKFENNEKGAIECDAYAQTQEEKKVAMQQKSKGSNA